MKSSRRVPSRLRPLALGCLLLAQPAFAQNVGTAGGNATGIPGGAGFGDGGVPGGAGPEFGQGLGGGNGGNGGPAPISGGGGGGSGSGGGGGSSGNLSSDARGTSGGIDGGDGGQNTIFGDFGGGGGGGGGAAGTFDGGRALATGSTWTGGAGGNGGAGTGNNGGGGGGGGGGVGVQTSNSMLVDAGAAVTGGAGGSGGAGLAGGSGGGGGGGGHGVVTSSSGSSVYNEGAITGGDGGAGGAGSSNSVFSGPAGEQGRGGEGIRMLNRGTVFSIGSISGGLSADGSLRANAITFANGGDLVIAPSSVITGNVFAAGSGSELILAGSANGIFDVSAIGAQYLGFDTFRKFDFNTYLLTGSGAQDWDLRGGTLAGNAASLGGSIGIKVGATLAFDASLPGSTHSGILSGRGAFVQVGAGTLTLLGDSGGFAGTTTVNGTLQIGNGGNTGALGGNITDNGALVFDRANDVTYGGAISGGGTLTQAGAGTLILTGDNSGHSGTTTISAGTLQVGNGTGTGTLGTGTVTNNSRLVFNRDGTLTVGNVIDGSGSVRQMGPGVLVLNGNNGYSGGTFLDAGTLRIGNNGALGTGTLTIAGGTLDATAPRRITNNILVTGDFSVFPGGTIPTLSAFELDGNMDLGGANRTITNTMDFNLAQFGQLSIGGSISNGGLTFADSGIAAGTNVVFFRLDGSSANTYTGDTVVGTNVSLTLAKDAGVTAVAGNATIRNEAVLVLLNNEQVADTATVRLEGRGQMQMGVGAAVTETIATLQDDGAGLAEIELEDAGGGSRLRVGAGSFSGAITAGAAGGVSLEKIGGGALVLSGNNTYLGNTLVSGGTLQIGAGGASGTLGAGEVTNNGNLAFNRSGTVTVGNTINGSGTLTQMGPGTLILTADNGYGGGTTISGGILQVGNGGGTGSLGGGAITNNAALAFNRSGTVTVGNTINGSGSVRQLGPGILVLDGNNGYGGGTFLDAGTLQVGHDNALGTGTLTIAAGTTLASAAPRRITNDIVVAGDFNVFPGGTDAFTSAFELDGNMNLGGANRTITNTMNIGLGQSGQLNIGGSIGNGGLTFADAGLPAGGNLVFFRLDGSAANTYTGETVVGTNVSLALAKTAGVTAANGDVRVRNGGTLLLLNSEQIADSAALRFEGNGRMQVGAGAAATETVASILDDGAGAAEIAIDFNGARLRVGAGNFAGRIVDGATGVVGLEKIGAGTLVLSSDSSYAGDTLIAGGTLQVGAGGASGSLGLGNVTNNGSLVFSRGDTFTVGSTISGTGSLTKAGAGTMILTADNGYGGGTTITGGTLQVGNGGGTGSLGSGNVVNDGALAFNRTGTVTVGGAISGTGTLAQMGPGTLVLAADNGYGGTTTIAAGTLQVGNGGATGSLGAGAVSNNGTLAFNRSGTLTVANALAGTGALVQAGPGTTVLTGVNNYTGGTFVNAGTLSVNGSIVGNTTVNNGGTLGGAGNVGSVAVASGGTLAPGNSIGTLSANGNLSFAAGSTYRVEANAAGAADRVNTVGAGTITINGGTVDVQAGGAGYQRNTAYTILSSGGATTGQFANATTNLAFLTPTLIYQANAVLLNLEASDAVSYASVARTRNQTAVASYLGSFANAASNGEAAALIQRIDNMTADQAASAFESMAGSAHSAASQVAGALGRNFSAGLAARSGFSTSGLGNAMNDWSRTHYASLDRSRFEPTTVTSDVVAQAGPARGVETPLASAQERGLWVQALGAGGRLDSDGNAAGSRYRSSGFVLGYDQPVTGQWLAGGALGYSSSWWNATSGDPASGKIESPQAGLYARYATNSFRLRLDGTFANHDFTTDRTVDIGGVGATANSKHKGREWGLAGQVEMPIKSGEWELRPLAGLRFAHLQEDGFSETGQGPANLAVAERTTQNTLLSAGMHFVRLFNQGQGGLELRAVASHLAGDNDSPVTASIAGQAGSFTADGVALKRNALTLGATVSGQFSRRVSAYLDANYEYRGSGQNAYQLTGGVRVTF